jgi:methionine-rich copper-binding protein CopC
MRNVKSALGALLASITMVVSPAFAHAELVHSSPAANATVSNGLKTITLTFNERLVPKFSKFELTMPAHSGMKVPVTTTVSRDGKQIVGTLKESLHSGDYKVLWTAAGSDGHRRTGEVDFRVR